jgi:putative phage-type endonuclease
VRIVECNQGTLEWYAARCGVPTASEFGSILTASGNRSAQRVAYMQRLAGERASGTPEDFYENAAMRRGKLLEAEARNHYAFITGNRVRQVGFCLDDSGFFGASPDGLITEAEDRPDEGCLEIKCPAKMAVHVSCLVANAMPMDHFMQTQGQLLVTGCSWCDFMSYYPGIRPLILRIRREEAFIGLARGELMSFCTELETLTKRIGG